ncbi:MAG: protein jag [Clostridia bacterium]|nr:protein jag [Clostridia bacterium]
MRTLDATGKSVDEAIFNGLRELAISIDEVEIEIIQQETKGILGIGAKPAIVRLKEREPEEIIIPDYVLNKDKPREPRERRERRDRNERRERRPRREEAAEEKAVQAETEEAVKEAEAAAAEETAETECAQEAPRQREPRQRRERRDRRERRPRKEEEPVLPREEIDYTAEAAEGNAAADFLKGLLKKMGVEAEVLANVSEEGIRLRIDSSSMGILIGHRGETLDAIQYLTSLAINRSRKETGYTRVTIDTEGYRDKREETLTRLARKIASQVKATGRARTLEPMNPYERRVLHATLQNHPYVTTYSEGEEPNRRVVIAPKGK